MQEVDENCDKNWTMSPQFYPFTVLTSNFLHLLTVNFCPIYSAYCPSLSFASIIIQQCIIHLFLMWMVINGGPILNPCGRPLVNVSPIKVHCFYLYPRCFFHLLGSLFYHPALVYRGFILETCFPRTCSNKIFSNFFLTDLQLISCQSSIIVLHLSSTAAWFW